MLLEQRYTPVFTQPMRLVRLGLYAFIVLVLMQAISPTSLEWLVPLDKPAASAVTTPAVMSHQPEEVNAIHDLWPRFAQHPAVTEMTLPTPWASELGTGAIHPTYQADLTLGRNNVARFNEGSVSVLVEEGTFSTPT